MDLLVAQHSLMLAKKVSDEGENGAPCRGTRAGIEQELRKRHAMQPRGNRNERTNHRNQPANQRADLAVLREEPLRALEILFAEKHVLAVARYQRPADPLSPEIIRQRSDETAEHAADQRHGKAHLSPRGQVS